MGVSNARRGSCAATRVNDLSSWVNFHKDNVLMHEDFANSRNLQQPIALTLHGGGQGFESLGSTSRICGFVGKTQIGEERARLHPWASFRSPPGVYTASVLFVAGVECPHRGLIGLLKASCLPSLSTINARQASRGIHPRAPRLARRRGSARLRRRASRRWQPQGPKSPNPKVVPGRANVK
jgi:hypothetical protein